MSNRDPRYPEILTVREVIERLSECDDDTLVLTCPEEPHVACHYVVDVTPPLPDEDHPVLFVTVEPGSPDHQRWLHERGVEATTTP